MKLLEKLFVFFNPVFRLGQKNYSSILPLSITLLVAVLLEFYAYVIVKDPNVVGIFAIFIFIALIIYFASRDGIKGGLVTTGVTICYYAYIIYTRQHKGQQLTTSIETTAILGILYIFISITIGWLKQTIDILIEREADEKRRLQTIIEQLPVGVVITDNKGVIQQTNKQLDTILGMKLPQGLIAGKHLFIKGKYGGEVMNESHSPLRQVLSMGSSINNREFVITRPDGKEVHISVSASVIHNKRGKVIAAASIISDITQQKELETRKDDFVNMASHELKTPVTSMKLYVESLITRLERHGDETNIKIIKNIKKQTERLQELINDLLDVSRIQTGKLTFTKETFRLEELIGETIDELRESVKQRKLHFATSSTISVYADKFRIYQVLTNLITNAVKYSPEESEITISLARKDRKCIVSVQDVGIGIAKHEQKKIFDRLYQVTDRKEKTFPGLGMGLYISKEIVVRHKGAIWVESQKGKGSTFYFTLPLAEKTTIER